MVQCAFLSLDPHASLGGADRKVILWSPTGDILRQFTHSGSVQALAFNPRTLILASGTTEELSLWNADGCSGLAEEEVNCQGSRSGFIGSKSWGMSHCASSSNRNSGKASSSLSNAIAVSLGLAGANSDLKSSQGSSNLQQGDRIKVGPRTCVLSWDDDGQHLAAGKQ